MKLLKLSRFLIFAAVVGWFAHDGVHAQTPQQTPTTAPLITSKSAPAPQTLQVSQQHAMELNAAGQAYEFALQQVRWAVCGENNLLVTDCPQWSSAPNGGMQLVMKPKTLASQPTPTLPVPKEKQ